MRNELHGLKRIAGAGLVGATLAAGGCGFGGALSETIGNSLLPEILLLELLQSVPCPRCDGTISGRGIDRFYFGMGDNKGPVKNCGFDYYEGHRGGSGDTLEEIGCDGSVYLAWAYGGLDTVAVREGWNGKTNRGLQIGDTRERLFEVYPDVSIRESGSGKMQKEVYTVDNVKFGLTEDGKVYCIEVQELNFPEQGIMSPAGPYEWR